MILCAGEAVIDMIPELTVSGRNGFAPHCGGAALNTAIALTGQGARVGLLAGLSRDRFGRQLDTALAGAGVDRSLTLVSDRPTTLAFVHLDDDEADYTFLDENSAGRMIRAAELPPLPDHVICLLLGGISLCHAPGADAFEALGERASDRLVMLDPNIRPRFVGDEPAYRARLQRMMAHAHIVKLSAADLDWIDPRPLPWRDRVKGILATGPSLILFTRGAQGAVAVTWGGQELAVAAHQVQVADTVGAGDAFNAGFLARLAQIDLLNPEAIRNISSDSLRDCLENAARVAAQALVRSGGA